MFTGGSHRTGWRLRRSGEELRVDLPARLRINNSFAARDAAIQGLGIAQLPLLVADAAQAAQSLVPVLSDWRPAPVPVHALFPSSRYLTPKVRAFIELASTHFAETGVPETAAQA